MKLFIAQMLVLACLVNATFADDWTSFSITTDQARDVKQKLDAYEMGKISLEDLGEKAGDDTWRQLIGYYLLHTNDISTKAKLPIGRCYAQFHAIPQAMKLGEEYANVYSNDWRGWRLLGYCYEVMNYTNEAIRAYSNAARLGNKLSYEQLAGFALRNGRSDVVGKIIPELLALKEAKETPEADRLALISVLLGYSMEAGRKDVFIKTLKGEDFKNILRNDQIKTDVTSGCGMFEGEDIDKIRQESEAPTSNDSKTNTVKSPSL
jgi:tetratricopeptide (TPR) repeat protein